VRGGKTRRGANLPKGTAAPNLEKPGGLSMGGWVYPNNFLQKQKAISRPLLASRGEVVEEWGTMGSDTRETSEVLSRNPRAKQFTSKRRRNAGNEQIARLKNKVIEIFAGKNAGRPDKKSKSWEENTKQRTVGTNKAGGHETPKKKTRPGA